ncbi:MAG: EpsI family protein [Paucibacter sp.]|nr:EpsI family protein [Roseateles sp.]
MAVVVAPHFVLNSLELSGGPVEFALTAPPLSHDKWQLEAAGAAPRFKPVIEHPRAEWQGSFHHPGPGTTDSQNPSVGLYIAYFRQQTYQSKLISSNHVLVKSNDADWAMVAAASASQPVGGLVLPLQTAELRRAGAASLGDANSVNDRLKVWRVYWINGRPMTSEWQAKVVGAVYRLLGRGDDAAMLVFYTDKLGGEARLQAFLRDNWLSLDAWLRATRDEARSSGPAPAAQP